MKFPHLVFLSVQYRIHYTIVGTAQRKHGGDYWSWKKVCRDTFVSSSVEPVNRFLGIHVLPWSLSQNHSPCCWKISLRQTPEFIHLWQGLYIIIICLYNSWFIQQLFIQQPNKQPKKHVINGLPFITCLQKLNVYQLNYGFWRPLTPGNSLKNIAFQSIIHPINRRQSSSFI